MTRRRVLQGGIVGLGTLMVGAWANLTVPKPVSSLPVRLAVPSLSLVAPVTLIPAAVDPLLERRLASAAWWAGSARPGEHGVAVITASPTLIGADLMLAEGVEIVLADGRDQQWRYTVVGRETVVPTAPADRESMLGIGVERSWLHLLVGDVGDERWLVVTARAAAASA